jgi:hypothetical protein
MALLLVFIIWGSLIGFVYRAHRSGGEFVADDRAPGAGSTVLGSRRLRADIPDTVPADWVETYRSENGG